MSKVKSSIHIFAGAPGSGKTLLATTCAFWALLGQTWLWALHHYSIWRWWPWKRRADERPPAMYSTVPVKLPLFCRIWHKRRYCYKLTREIVLGIERIPRGSQIVWDEIGGSANQFLYKHGVKQLSGVDDFSRFCRQYTYGQIWCTDQSPDNISYHYTRRSGDTFVINNIHLPMFLPIGWCSGITVMSVVDMPSLTDSDTGIVDKLFVDRSFRLFLRPFWPLRIYDSHIFYRRYLQRPVCQDVSFQSDHDISAYRISLSNTEDELQIYD